MHRTILVAALLLCTACRSPEKPGDYLFVWAGDSAGTASDFLAVLNANPASPQYGAVVTTLTTGVAGTHPHHTEATMPASGHLLANGFHAGQSWLFDLTTPRTPRILATFGDVAGFSHPHTYTRLASGNVLATFQYAADSMAGMPHQGDSTMATMMPAPERQFTGGLVEMKESGEVIRSGSAADPNIPDRRIFPYSVVTLPAADIAVSTTTNMDERDTVATDQWVQFWKLSDLTLQRSIALPTGPRGNEQTFTGEPFLLPDGTSLYIHTFYCGLYLIQGADGPAPSAELVTSFPGLWCGVPILTGHWFLQPVPELHGLVALDITDPAHPREVSTVSLGDDEAPHWAAIDPSGTRIVVNSAGSGSGNRVFIVVFDPKTGILSLDKNFRDPGSHRAGVRMGGKRWPHGFGGTAIPHGSVFSR